MKDIIATTHRITPRGTCAMCGAANGDASAECLGEGKRFVLIIGDIREVYRDIPDGWLDIHALELWDRQERKPVFTLHAGYSNAVCLETTRNGNDDQPITRLEEWFNGLTNEDLESEGIVPTDKVRFPFEPLKATDADVINPGDLKD